jgi:hemin uptake protein HemP
MPMADAPLGRDSSDRDAAPPAAAARGLGPPVTGPLPPQKSAGRAAAPVIRSADLLQGGGEVHILHNGETYRLTVTRAGKLILHK